MRYGWMTLHSDKTKYFQFSQLFFSFTIFFLLFKKLKIFTHHLVPENWFITLSGINKELLEKGEICFPEKSKHSKSGVEEVNFSILPTMWFWVRNRKKTMLMRFKGWCKNLAIFLLHYRKKLVVEIEKSLR